MAVERSAEGRIWLYRRPDWDNEVNGGWTPTTDPGTAQTMLDADHIECIEVVERTSLAPEGEVVRMAPIGNGRWVELAHPEVDALDDLRGVVRFLRLTDTQAKEITEAQQVANDEERAHEARRQAAYDEQEITEEGSGG